MTITKGTLKMMDFGEPVYGLGIMQGNPVYNDMPQDEIDVLPDEPDVQPHAGDTFDMICVKGANSEEEAIKKCVDSIIELNPNVTDEILDEMRAHKMVHQENGYIWATTCGPCIGEMPELEKLNQEFQAKAIVSDTGVTYTNIIGWDGFKDVFAAPVTPTTYFVDSNGNIIGDPIMGAIPDQYVARMNEYLGQ